MLEQKILSNSSAIRTLVHPSVQSLIKNVKPDFDNVNEYKTSIKEWLKPIVDLNDFFVYPMNGVTEGLNWWYDKEKRSVTMETGDYQWIKPRQGKGQIHYVSVPSSIHGNFVQVPDNISTVVDLAYVGSTKIKKIKIPKKTEVVFYSMSKSFGIRNIRTGWIFSRKEDRRLEALCYGAKYYNYFARDISEKIMSNFDIDFVFNTYKTQQQKVCKQLNLEPSDSVWIATSKDTKYSKFRRSGDIARLCLAGVYNE